MNDKADKDFEAQKKKTKRGPLDLDKLQNIRRMLRRQGEKSMKLAEELKSYGGIPLKEDEKTLIRVAYMPVITEMTEMLRVNFLMGNIDNMASASEEIATLIHELSDL
jgi:hypothetical protein